MICIDYITKHAYKENPDKCRAASKLHYLKEKSQICKERRDKYSLRTFKVILISKYIKGIAKEFLANAEIKLQLTMEFYKRYKAYTLVLFWYTFTYTYFGKSTVLFLLVLLTITILHVG